MTNPSLRCLSHLAQGLRSPLTIIGGTLTELAATPVLPAAERDRIVSRSQQELKRLLLLSDRLFLAAQIDEGLEVSLTRVDLVQLTQDTLAQFVGLQLRSEIEVVTAYPDAPLNVSGDRALLVTLLLELLTNANRAARNQFRVAITRGEAAVLSSSSNIVASSARSPGTFSGASG